MFDIGFIEMLVVGLILLLVVGPERLPEVARTIGGWVFQAKQYVDGMKEDLDRETGFSEIQREAKESVSGLERDLKRPLEEDAGQKTDSKAESDADSRGEGEAKATEAGDDEAVEGRVAPAPEADHRSEDAAASDMERELAEPDPNLNGDDETRRE